MADRASPTAGDDAAAAQRRLDDTDTGSETESSSETSSEDETSSDESSDSDESLRHSPKPSPKRMSFRTPAVAAAPVSLNRPPSARGAVPRGALPPSPSGGMAGGAGAGAVGDAGQSKGQMAVLRSTAAMASSVGFGAGLKSILGADNFALDQVPTTDPYRSIEDCTCTTYQWWQLLFCGLLLIPVGLEAAMWTFLTFGHVCARVMEGKPGHVQLHYFCGLAPTDHCETSGFNTVCLDDTALAVVMLLSALSAIVGSYVFGGMADQYGRSLVLRLCAIGSFVGIVIGFPLFYPLFVLARAATSFFLGGVHVVFTLMSELATWKARNAVLTVLHAFWLVGFLIGMVIGLFGLADVSLSARAIILQYIALLPAAGAAVIALSGHMNPSSFWSFSESPRWLALYLACQRVESPTHSLRSSVFKEAHELLVKMGEVNNKPLGNFETGLPRDILAYLCKYRPLSGSFSAALAGPIGMLTSKDRNVNKYSVKLFVGWLTSGFCWYGVVLAVPFLITAESNASHYPINFVIAVEMIVSYIVGGLVLGMMGKKFAGVWFAALGSLWLIPGIIFVLIGTGVLVSFLLSIFLTSSVLTMTALVVVVVVASVEGYSTVHRGSAYGLNYGGFLLGGFLAQILTLFLLLRSGGLMALNIALLILAGVVCAACFALLPTEHRETPEDRMLCDIPGRPPAEGAQPETDVEMMRL